MRSFTKREIYAVGKVGVLIDPKERHRLVVLGRGNLLGAAHLLVCRVEGDGKERRVELVSYRRCKHEALASEMVKAGHGHRAPLMVATGDACELVADMLRHQHAQPMVQIFRPGAMCCAVAQVGEFLNQRTYCAYQAMHAAKQGRVSLGGVSAALRAEVLDQLRHVSFGFTFSGRVVVEHSGGKVWSLLSVMFSDALGI